MAIRYERDDVERRAVITISGPLDVEEVLACVEQHRLGGAWNYRLLYDVRHLTEEPGRDTLRELAVLSRPRPGEVARGPVAVLSTSPSIYAAACSYAAMVKSFATFAVFRDRDEAEAWLRSVPA
jgi:hypothetical protein